MSGWTDSLEDFPPPPDDELLDTTRCPLGSICAGCGGREGLRAVTAAFSRPDGYDVACATLCDGCDGRSFLHLLEGGALERAFSEHSRHSRPNPAG